jgi:hypothetical protein
MPTTLIEQILCHGHENIKATHKSTLEITKEEYLSSEGDCIIGVRADKGMCDFRSEFKNALRKPNSKLTVLVEVGDVAEKIEAYGCGRSSLSHSTDIVVRKSDHVSSRTLGIHSDKAACDLSRELVEKLKNPRQIAKITFLLTA